MKKIITIILIVIVGMSSIGCEIIDDGFNWVYDEIKDEFIEQRYSKEPRYSKAVKWTDGIVYYKWHDNVDEKARNIIINCMMDFEEISSLRFVESNKNEYSCLIILNNDKNCVHKIGMHRDNYLRLTYSLFICNNASIIRHELGHLIGLHHEHQREDRDKYIKVNWNNIKESKYYQYVIVKNDLIPENKFTYDPISIMHYRTRDGLECINNTTYCYLGFISWKMRNVTRDIFSQDDIEKIQYLYPMNNL